MEAAGVVIGEVAGNRRLHSGPRPEADDPVVLGGLASGFAGPAARGDAAAEDRHGGEHERGGEGGGAPDAHDNSRVARDETWRLGNRRAPGPVKVPGPIDKGITLMMVRGGTVPSGACKTGAPIGRNVRRSHRTIIGSCRNLSCSTATD